MPRRRVYWCALAAPRTLKPGVTSCGMLHRHPYCRGPPPTRHRSVRGRTTHVKKNDLKAHTWAPLKTATLISTCHVIACTRQGL